ncbi:hypothetical protein GC170_08185 [bacterium]|nr:hypothetical protein [bacterium]
MHRTDSLLILAAVGLAGASSSSAAQAAMYAASIRSGMPGVDSLVIAMIWWWVAVSAFAVVCGLAGGYRAVRSGVIRQPLILTFFLLYALTLRVDNVSLGWPWQFHLGMVMGRIGLGVNVVGAFLLTWYLKAIQRPPDHVPATSVETSIATESMPSSAS